MKIAFHSNQLCLRGTEVALYDYAHFNEWLLQNSSIIVTPRNSFNHVAEAIQRFGARFEVFFYESLDHLWEILLAESVELLYCIKSGQNDGIVSPVCKTAVHAVFGYCEPHGDYYAYVSDWLAKYASNGRFPAVPHMVHLPQSKADLRAELGIPAQARVFGRHGGAATFDLDFVHQSVLSLAQLDPNTYFLFLGTDQFCSPHPRIIHLEASGDALRKRAFINSCDAMLHARHSGETFGLAVGEFAIAGKPILTYSESNERAHLEFLGANALTYNDSTSLVTRIDQITRAQIGSAGGYAEMTPENVMIKFKQIFLRGR